MVRVDDVLSKSKQGLKMRNQRTKTRRAINITVGLTVIAIFLTFVFGWIMNIVYLIQNIDALSIGYIALGIVGIFFAPLGSILYFFVW